MGAKNTSNLKPFPKGVSGNPGGRAKGYERQLRDVIDGMTALDPVPDPEGAIDAATKETRRIPAWQAIVKRAILQAVEGDKYAREFIADRLLGKPKQHVDFVPPPSRAKADLSKMPTKRKRELLRAYEALQQLAGAKDESTEEGEQTPTEH